MRTNSLTLRHLILFISLVLTGNKTLNATRPVAAKRISCIHKFYCDLTQKLLTNKQNTPIKYFFPPSATSGPHHFSPRPKTIKQLLSADYLISGSELLSPWAGPIIRRKNKLHASNVFNWELPQKKHALAHLWLFPKLYCRYQNALKNQLLIWQFKLKETDSKCHQQFELKHKRYKQKLKQYFKLPVIIGHDSLSPLFEDLDLDYFVIKGHGHHQQISLKTLKSLQDFQRLHPQVIWIFEKQIHLAEGLYKKQREKDLWLEIDTSGRNNHGPFQFYDTLLAKQLKSGEKKDHDR